MLLPQTAFGIVQEHLNLMQGLHIWQPGSTLKQQRSGVAQTENGMLLQGHNWELLQPAIQRMRLMYLPRKGMLLDRSFDPDRCSHVILGLQGCIYCFA